MLIGGEDEVDLDLCWQLFLNGRLRRALGQSKDMEDFRLHTTGMDRLLLLPTQDQL